jgi:hypothetical protein
MGAHDEVRFHIHDRSPVQKQRDSVTAMNEPNLNARELASLVLVEAVGSSMTPFVPLPFVDDYLFGRLLRRITRKVVERTGRTVEKAIEKAVVEGYLNAGDVGLGEKAVTAAARFVVRKVAVVLDVKKSHDVFGESIAFALALDVAVELGPVDHMTALPVGGAIYRATQSVGSAALEVISRAAAEAFKATEAASRVPPSADPRLPPTGVPSSSSGRFARLADAIGRHVDITRAHLDRSMRYELSRAVPTAPR